MPRQGGLLERRAAACLLLAQATVSSGAYRGQRDDNEIRLLQWNPHWECVAWNEHECGRYAKESLWAELVGHSIDFANIVELGFADKDLPAGWRAIRHKCGVDVIELMYLSHRWKVSDGHGALASGCMDKHDRPFIVQQFDDVSATGGGRRIIIVAAHYPHSKDRSMLRSALASVAKATGVQEMILIADTNEDFSVSNDKVMRDINAPGKSWVSTDLHNTCCWNNGVNSFAQGNTYDRIIANFGRMVSTTVLPLPVWGRTGEFHRAVRGVLVDAPDEEDGDEVPFRALQHNMTRKAPLRQLGSVARPGGRGAAGANASKARKHGRTLLLNEAESAPKTVEEIAKSLEEAKAAVDEAHLDVKKALAGRKEAERLAEEAAQESQKAEKLNAAATEQVIVAVAAEERAEQLRQDLANNTEGSVVQKSLADRLKAEEDLFITHSGKANKTMERATTMQSRAAKLSERSHYMMSEAEDRENAAKQKLEDAEARISTLKEENASAQQQVDKDYDKALAKKRQAIKDAAKAKEAMKAAEKINLKVERDRLNAADMKKKAEQEEQDAKAFMGKEKHNDYKIEVKWKKSQKDMKAARAANAAANEMASKAANAAEEATAQMEKVDLEMASADKTFYVVEPLLDEARKKEYNHPDSGAKADEADSPGDGKGNGARSGARHNSSDGGSMPKISNASRLLKVREELEGPSSLSLAAAAFLLAAPLLACGATVVSHAVRAQCASEGSRVRPCDGGEADGAGALLQDERHEEKEQRERTNGAETEGGDADAQPEEGSQGQEDSLSV